MVIVNCASLPATLIESELFGREAGAYTGAASAQVGRFTLADGSTLFLDEIGEFPVELQAKLLRVLQDGRFERLGSPESVTVNVRIIAATNRDLEQAMRDGKFRADLYHRLNVFPIRVPPLRERREDIPLLVWAFVEVFGRRMGKTINSIPRRTMEQLQQYSWPGNVRELSNVIERAMILTTGDSLVVEIPILGPGSLRTPNDLERKACANRSFAFFRIPVGESEVPVVRPRSWASSQRRWSPAWRSSASPSEGAAPIFRRFSEYRRFAASRVVLATRCDKSLRASRLRIFIRPVSSSARPLLLNATRS